MNLHLLHTDPTMIPQFLDNKRVGKMLMETNQMLSLAVKHHMREKGQDFVPHVGPGMLTNGWSHYNHPVSVWVRASGENFAFTLTYALALEKEFIWRFGKEHESGQRTLYIRRKLMSEIPRGSMTPFQNSARHEGRGIDFTNYEPVEAYRRYMLYRWETDKTNPKWTRRADPRRAWEELYDAAFQGAA